MKFIYTLIMMTVLFFAHSSFAAANPESQPSTRDPVIEFEPSAQNVAEPRCIECAKRQRVIIQGSIVDPACQHKEDSAWKTCAIHTVGPGAASAGGKSTAKSRDADASTKKGP